MIFDLHNDILFESLSIKEKHQYFLRNKNSKIVSAFWTTDKTFDILATIEQYIAEFSSHKNAFFAVEDLFFVNAQNMERVCSLPLMYCTLAWRHDNSIAGGHEGSSGVSKFGKQLIKKLNLHNIAVDTAHLNHKSFFDVLDSAKYVLCSHACQNEVFFHTRNLFDQQIKLIVERGGIVGLTAVDKFMTNSRASRENYLYQILRFLDKFGDNNIAIGTDFFGATPLEGLCEYNHFAILKRQLRAAGISKHSIAKLFYLNAECFYERLLKNRCNL